MFGWHNLGQKPFAFCIHLTFNCYFATSLFQNYILMLCLNIIGFRNLEMFSASLKLHGSFGLFYWCYVSDSLCIKVRSKAWNLNYSCFLINTLAVLTFKYGISALFTTHYNKILKFWVFDRIKENQWWFDKFMDDHKNLTHAYSRNGGASQMFLVCSWFAMLLDEHRKNDKHMPIRKHMSALRLYTVFSFSSHVALCFVNCSY